MIVRSSCLPEGLLDEVQVQAPGALEDRLLALGVDDLVLEPPGPQGEPHPLVEQDQQLAVDLVDLASDVVELHSVTSPSLVLLGQVGLEPAQPPHQAGEPVDR